MAICPSWNASALLNISFISKVVTEFTLIDEIKAQLAFVHIEGVN